MHFKTLILVLGLVCCIQIAAAGRSKNPPTGNPNVDRSIITSRTCSALTGCKNVIKSGFTTLIENGQFYAHRVRDNMSFRNWCNQKFPKPLEILLAEKTDFCSKCISFVDIGTRLNSALDQYVKEAETVSSTEISKILTKIQNITLSGNTSPAQSEFTALLGKLRDRKPNGNEIIAQSDKLLEKLDSLTSKLNGADKKIVQNLKSGLETVTILKQGIIKKSLSFLKSTIDTIKNNVTELRNRFPDVADFKITNNINIENEIVKNVFKKMEDIVAYGLTKLKSAIILIFKLFIGICELYFDVNRLQLCNQLNGYIDKAGKFGNMMCSVFVNVETDANPFEAVENKLSSHITYLEKIAKTTPSEGLKSAIANISRKYTDLYAYKQQVELKKLIKERLEKPENITTECWTDKVEPEFLRVKQEFVSCEQHVTDLKRKDYLTKTIKQDVEKCQLNKKKEDVVPGECLITFNYIRIGVQEGKRKYAECLTKVDETNKNITAKIQKEASKCKPEDKSSWFQNLELEFVVNNHKYKLDKCLIKQIMKIIKS